MAKKMTKTNSKPRTKMKSMAKSAAQLTPEQARKLRGGTGYQIISAGPEEGFKSKK